MRRRILALTLLLLVTMGCGRVPAPPGVPSADGVTAPASTPGPPNEQTPPQPSPQFVPQPPAPAGPAVRAIGDELEIAGMPNAWLTAWAPSGLRGLLQNGRAYYLLDLSARTLTPVPDLDPLEPPRFWSETEVLWQRDGRLRLRDLTTGTDRLLHDFGTHVIHYLQPGDTHYVANREKGVVQQGYRFGTIVTGRLGASGESTLIETGHLIGRMATGHTLAVEGYRGGPLWAIAPAGEKRLLSPDPAYFVQLSPEGKRALWLTGPTPKASWLDLLRPAVAHADPPYDPPLAYLWTWDGAGDPARISLGGTYSVRAEFSPDGTRIALALNPPFDEAKPYAGGPGRLAVAEAGAIRVLATFEDGQVGLGMWLAADGFHFMPPAGEKTGAQAPIMQIDLQGQQGLFSGGFWKEARTRPTEEGLILNWMGDRTTVHWRGSAIEARVAYRPGELRDPLYVPPWAAYLPFQIDNGLRLLPLKRP